MLLLLTSFRSWAGDDVYGLGNGQDGNLDVPSGGFVQPVKTYRLDSDVAKDSQTLVLNSAYGLEVGDLMMLVRIQEDVGSAFRDDAITLEDAGSFELFRIEEIGSDQATLTADSSFLRDYPIAATQLVPVFEFVDVTVATSAQLVGPFFSESPYYGGGVLAFLATGTVTLDANARIDASSRGFEAGGRKYSGTSCGSTAPELDSGGAEKGHGVATGSPTNGYGRYANAAGGGACADGGAGGGGLAGVGGAGAHPTETSSNGTDWGGQGGASLSSTDVRLLLGGGGGGGTAGDGGSGGGIVFLRANAIVGSGTIAANGSVTTAEANGGGGGGGAGGTIHVATRDTIDSTVTLSADGGDAAPLTNTSVFTVKPGGGGSGGVVRIQAAPYNSNGTQLEPGVTVAGGAAGVGSGAEAGAEGVYTAQWVAFDPDYDGDGLGDIDEQQIGSDPRVTDSDEDGLSDGDEVDVYLTDPTDEDTDGDGLTDGDEIAGLDGIPGGDDTLDPTKPDTDEDGLLDGEEWNPDGESEYATDALVPDTDEDGLLDGEEVLDHETDPLEPDTDGDGLLDGEEVLEHETDPLEPDTDGDDLSDGDEVQVHDTNPLVHDTDGDGMWDGDEVAWCDDDLGTCLDPTRQDTDGDTLWDLIETLWCIAAEECLDPLRKDTDEGGVEDNDELYLYFTNPLDAGDDYPCVDAHVTYADADSDGWGNSATEAYGCPSQDRVETGGDCDDEKKTVHPDREESCDGVDQDCDGDVDEGLLQALYTDADGDGWGVPPVALICPGDGLTDNDADFDCDDADADAHPGLTEVCDDGRDNDCSGVENDQDADGCRTWYRDVDGDGFGLDEACLCERDPATHFDTREGGDCDDSDDDVWPGATELCNGADEDCDEDVDEELTWDADGDGATASGSCEGAGDDCDDTLPTVLPGATEACNGLDDDCDEDIDEGLTWDDDADAATSEGSCAGSADDCDDTDPFVHPGAAEVVDGTDNDCDDEIDEDPLRTDDDGDLFCEDEHDCDDGSQPGDCDDALASRSPAATEVQNGIDDDCDGVVDAPEADGDGDGHPASQDCNDADDEVYPGAPETCNGRDDDCDGALAGEEDFDHDGSRACLDCDDDDPSVRPGLAEDCSDGKDNDCDGTTDRDANADGDPYTTCQGDCNDADSNVNPQATEVCNGIDDDCNGQTDEVFDHDDDGWRDCIACAGLDACDCDDANALVHPERSEICPDQVDNDCDGTTDSPTDEDNDGWTSCDGDCNDRSGTVSPGSPEVCDARDNDCDGAVDETFDRDYDDFTTCTGDCDDGDGTAYLGANELCNDRDDDCDGVVDEAWPDRDEDGVTSCSGDCDDEDPLVSLLVPEDCERPGDEDCDGDADATDPDCALDGDTGGLRPVVVDPETLEFRCAHGGRTVLVWLLATMMLRRPTSTARRAR